MVRRRVLVPACLDTTSVLACTALTATEQGKLPPVAAGTRAVPPAAAAAPAIPPARAGRRGLEWMHPVVGWIGRVRKGLGRSIVLLSPRRLGARARSVLAGGGAAQRGAAAKQQARPQNGECVKSAVKVAEHALGTINCRACESSVVGTSMSTQRKRQEKRSVRVSVRFSAETMAGGEGKTLLQERGGRPGTRMTQPKFGEPRLKTQRVNDLLDIPQQSF